MFDKILGAGQPIHDLPHYPFICLCGKALHLAYLSSYFLYRFPMFVVGSAHTSVLVDLYDTANYMRQQPDMQGLMSSWPAPPNMKVLDYV